MSGTRSRRLTQLEENADRTPEGSDWEHALPEEKKRTCACRWCQRGRRDQTEQQEEREALGTIRELLGCEAVRLIEAATRRKWRRWSSGPAVPGGS